MTARAQPGSTHAPSGQMQSEDTLRSGAVGNDHAALQVRMWVPTVGVAPLGHAAAAVMLAQVDRHENRGRRTTLSRPETSARPRQQPTGANASRAPARSAFVSASLSALAQFCASGRPAAAKGMISSGALLSMAVASLVQHGNRRTVGLTFAIGCTGSRTIITRDPAIHPTLGQMCFAGGASWPVP
jgi:hypothetical protein